jgi:hypothetical protein
MQVNCLNTKIYKHDDSVNTQDCKYCEREIRCPADYTQSYTCPHCGKENSFWHMDPIKSIDMPNIPTADLDAYNRNQQAGDNYKESVTTAFYCKYPEFEKYVKGNIKIANFNNYHMIKMCKHIELHNYTQPQKDELKTQILKFLDSYRGNIASAYTLQVDEIMRNAKQSFKYTSFSEKARADWDNKS